MAWHFDVEVYLEILGLAFVVFFVEVWLDVETKIVTIESEPMETELLKYVKSSSCCSRPSGND